MPKINNIVLVHGGFVDGAGWRGVYDILKKDGLNVSIVQNPTISLAGDVDAAKLVNASQPAQTKAKVGWLGGSRPPTRAFEGPVAGSLFLYAPHCRRGIWLSCPPDLLSLNAAGDSIEDGQIRLLNRRDGIIDREPRLPLKSLGSVFSAFGLSLLPSLGNPGLQNLHVGSDFRL
jgi:hypothetical protein